MPPQTIEERKNNLVSYINLTPDVTLCLKTLSCLFLYPASACYGGHHLVWMKYMILWLLDDCTLVEGAWIKLWPIPIFSNDIIVMEWIWGWISNNFFQVSSCFIPRISIKERINNFCPMLSCKRFFGIPNSRFHS